MMLFGCKFYVSIHHSDTTDAPHMMPYMRKLILILGCSLFVSSHAETYMGMKPDSSLGDIKQMFPNAALTPVNAAWVTESDGFYRMTGTGIAGTVYLAFSDSRPHSRGRIPTFEQRVAELRKLKQTDEVKRKLDAFATMLRISQQIAVEPTDKALKLKWVRWVPATPIPLSRYVTKYGEPTDSGFNDDMRAYKAWPEFGVTVTLTDDVKMVFATQFEFTAKETRDECMATYKVAAVCD